MAQFLQRLYLKDFRNHESLKIDLTARTTVLTGSNGRGKTNILEAINFLSILRSWRTNGVRDLIKQDCDFFELQARFNDSSEHTIAVRQALSSRLLSVDGEPIRKSSDFIRRFRTVVFSPEDKTIVAGSAQFRRRWIDGALSMQSHFYLTALQNYSRALVGRNAVLKKSSTSNPIIAAFDQVLIPDGLLVMKTRKQYASELVREVNLLIGTPRFAMEYAPNAPSNADEYQDELNKNLNRDKNYGFTMLGPQADDFKMFLDGKPLRSFGSSGQLRKTALLLKLAELKLAKQHNLPVAALVDDVCGELDEANRAHFFELCSVCDQLVMTFTELPRDRFFSNVHELPV